MGRLFASFIAVIFVSLVMLLTGGMLIDCIFDGLGFYRYRVGMFDRIPFWFLAILFLVALNGFWMLKLCRHYGRTEFSPFRENGRVSWDVPVQYGILFGRNLVVICVILFLFIILQGGRF